MPKQTLEELPYAWALRMDKNEQRDQIMQRCSFCCKTTKQQKCKNCQTMTYCDDICMQNDWQWHKAECQALCAAPDKKELLINSYSYTRLIGRIISRKRIDQGCPNEYKQGWEKRISRTLASLMPNIDKIEQSQSDTDDFNDTLNDFKAFFKAVPEMSERISREELKELYGKIRTNAFAMETYSLQQGSNAIGIALYLNCSRFDHSCKPDLIYWLEDNKMKMRQSKGVDLEALDNQQFNELTTKYVGSSFGIFGIALAEERRKILQARYWFTCQCELCQDRHREEMLQFSLAKHCKKCNGILILKCSKGGGGGGGDKDANIMGKKKIQCVSCAHIATEEEKDKKGGDKKEIIYSIIQSTKELCEKYNQKYSREVEVSDDEEQEEGDKMGEENKDDTTVAKTQKTEHDTSDKELNHKLKNGGTDEDETQKCEKDYKEEKEATDDKNEEQEEEQEEEEEEHIHTKIGKYYKLLKRIEKILNPMHNLQVIRLRKILFEYFYDVAVDEESFTKEKRERYANRAAEQGLRILESYDCYLSEYSIGKALLCYQLYRVWTALDEDIAQELLPKIISCLKDAKDTWQFQCPTDHPCVITLTKLIDKTNKVLKQQ